MTDESDIPEPADEPNRLQETQNDARVRPLTPQGRTDAADADGPSTGRLDAEDDTDDA